MSGLALRFKYIGVELQLVRENGTARLTAKITAWSPVSTLDLAAKYPIALISGDGFAATTTSSIVKEKNCGASIRVPFSTLILKLLAGWTMLKTTHSVESGPLGRVRKRANLTLGMTPRWSMLMGIGGTEMLEEGHCLFHVWEINISTISADTMGSSSAGENLR